jgi:hypothetical protein
MKEFKPDEEVYYFDGISVPRKARIICKHTEKSNDNLSYHIRFLDRDPESWSANRVTFDWYLYPNLNSTKKAVAKHVDILSKWIARPFWLGTTIKRRPEQLK